MWSWEYTKWQGQLRTSGLDPWSGAVANSRTAIYRWLSKTLWKPQRVSNGFTTVFYRANGVCNLHIIFYWHERELQYIYNISAVKTESWYKTQLCHHTWHLKIGQHMMPTVTTKLASWQLPVFRVISWFHKQKKMLSLVYCGQIISYSSIRVFYLPVFFRDTSLTVRQS